MVQTLPPVLDSVRAERLGFNHLAVRGSSDKVLGSSSKGNCYIVFQSPRGEGVVQTNAGHA